MGRQQQQQQMLPCHDARVGGSCCRSRCQPPKQQFAATAAGAPQGVSVCMGLCACKPMRMQTGTGIFVLVPAWMPTMSKASTILHVCQQNVEHQRSRFAETFKRLSNKKIFIKLLCHARMSWAPKAYALHSLTRLCRYTVCPGHSLPPSL